MGISPSSVTKKKSFTWCDTSHPLQIIYEGKPVKVFPLYVENMGNALYIDKSMVVDEQGIIYMSYWDKDKESVTRGQRKAQTWKVSDKKYHRYADGLASLERAVRAALFNAEGNTDLLAQSYLICDAIGQQLQESVSLKELTSKEMLKYLEEFEEKLARKSSAPLAEARNKIQSLLLWTRDKEGKPKLVIFRTKWTAILDRHKERIEIIQAWSKVYAARLYEIIMIRERFSLMLVRLQAQVQVLQSKLKADEKLSEDTKKSILILAPKFAFELKRWNLKPYKQWSTHTLRDVGRLENAAIGNSRSAVVTLLEKLELAILMKEFHHEVDYLNQYLASRKMEESIIRGKRRYVYDKDSSELIHAKYFWLAQFIYGTDDTILTKRVMPFIKFLWTSRKTMFRNQGANWSKMTFSDPKQHEEMRELLREISRKL